MKNMRGLVVLCIFNLVVALTWAEEPKVSNELTPADKMAANSAGVSLAGTVYTENAVVGNLECPTRRAVVVKHSDGTYSAVIYSVDYIPRVEDYFRRADEETAKQNLRGHSFPVNGFSVMPVYSVRGAMTR